MSERVRGFLLNAALAGAGLLALVLLWAFATGTVLPAVDPARAVNPAGLAGDVVQVEVRNGCGAAGVAATTTAFLRRHGFDVVGSGNHATFDEPETLVYDCVGNAPAARAVAEALGLDGERVRPDGCADYYQDAVVVLGRDYPTLRPFATASDL